MEACCLHSLQQDHRCYLGAAGALHRSVRKFAGDLQVPLSFQTPVVREYALNHLGVLILV